MQGLAQPERTKRAERTWPWKRGWREGKPGLGKHSSDPGRTRSEQSVCHGGTRKAPGCWDCLTSAGSVTVGRSVTVKGTWRCLGPRVHLREQGPCMPATARLAWGGGPGSRVGPDRRAQNEVPPPRLVVPKGGLAGPEVSETALAPAPWPTQFRKAPNQPAALL